MLGVNGPLYLLCQHEREGTLSARQKWCEYEEMLADGRFGFQAKVN